MARFGELDLLPITDWQAPPTYFISAGGLGYLALSWLMYYISQYLPPGKGMQDFFSARFLAIDTTSPSEHYDLPQHDWAREQLFIMEGDLNKIIDEVDSGFYPGIKDFYEDTPVAKTAREDIGGNLKDGAGTTRPFGRIGFLYNWQDVYNRLHKVIKDPINTTPMRFGKTFNVISGTSRQFYVVTSLAGGTGSSCFLDIAATLHKIRRDNYPSEQWTIIGIFTLADVLASDKKVSVELHRKKMRANTYAALKELNHFLSGQTFRAKYGRTGEVEVEISNTRDQDKLFDLVFLVDTPNQNNQPLSGRKEVSQFLAQVMLQLGLTTLNKEVSNRVIDMVANMAFRQQYPPDYGVDDGRERQQFLFSSVGLSTLELPVKSYVKYSCYRMAEKLVGMLWNTETEMLDDNFVDRVVNDIGLNETRIESDFNFCLAQVVLDIETELSNVRSAANPMDRIRNLAGDLENFPVDEVRREARLLVGRRMDYLFPKGGGAVRQEMDRLVQKGFLPHVPVILSEIIEGLSNYQTRLERELDEARTRAQVGETPAPLSNDSSNRGITQSQIYVDVLNVMEQSWSTWQNRFLRGFYRSRFFSQFEGEIATVFESFLRYQETANRLIVWPEKIGLVQEVIKNLKALKEYYTRQQSHLEKIKSELFRRKSVIEKSVDPGNRYKLLATDAETYFQEIFMNHIGSEDEILSSMVEKLKSEGLVIEGGEAIKLDQWELQPAPSIVDGLYSFCKKQLLGSEPDPEGELDSAHQCYRDGLDHAIFHPQDHPSSFSKVISTWTHRSGLSLLFSTNPPESSRYVISGCRTGDEPWAWDKVLNLHALNMYSGGAPNKCTLITLGLGFPICSVARIQDWFKFYTQLRRDGWPLHLFNEEDLEVMIEPHLEWLRQPSAREAAELFQEACQCNIILVTQSSGSSGEQTAHIPHEFLENLPAYIKNFFCDYRIDPKSYAYDELTRVFQEEKNLLGTLKNYLLNWIQSQDSSDEDKWSQRREQILNETANLEDILSWSKEARLLIEETGQYHFTEELCITNVFSVDPFSTKFFERREVFRNVTEEEFVNALQNRETLCRWITKKVLRRLTDIAQKRRTIARLSNNEFCDFLWDAVARHLDYRT